MANAFSVGARLRDRVAVITGGANGIGLGCALRFAEEGARVAIIDLEQDALNDARASFEGFPHKPLLVAGDCTKHDEVETFIERVSGDLGPVDILVNNVGQGARERKATFLESTEEVWRFVVEINLFTTMRFSRLVAPGMVERGWGRIINVASESAVIGPVGSHDYGAAKMGVIGFTRAVARELAPHGVTVNALCPGPVRTRALERSAGDEAKKAVASIPTGALGEPEDIAAMAALLASDEGRYITGQSILINGGRWWL
ncbi:SDR family NAD(P)-dependent oxidoreductase [Terricaulis silvestris]|uniref:D-xylose 1-dehydrogenase n=1 Tax=Terricaulis silvestris TaxID=2686094 RepID=A0A6I6MGB0_9CAUL|nr:SDR family oxidoreductase [Terricaulis silvestris]QGZ93675.1 3-oxoacyl-[acyl-carrier-protein] reductase FabG [Terricaulis silvestris]